MEVLRKFFTHCGCCWFFSKVNGHECADRCGCGWCGLRAGGVSGGIDSGRRRRTGACLILLWVRWSVRW